MCKVKCLKLNFLLSFKLCFKTSYKQSSFYENVVINKMYTNLFISLTSIRLITNKTKILKENMTKVKNN